MIYEAADPNANIIWGAAIDENMGDEVMVTVIATGFDGSMPIRTSKYIERVYNKDKEEPVEEEEPVIDDYDDTGETAEEYTPEPDEEPEPEPEEDEEDKGINIPNFLRKL